LKTIRNANVRLRTALSTLEINRGPVSKPATKTRIFGKKEYFPSMNSSEETPAYLEQLKVLCTHCGHCNCQGEWFPSRISRSTIDNWDETLYVDPHGVRWCENCETHALVWNSRICDHCGLHQDNERYYFPRYGHELCRECAEDEAWYEDKAAKHKLERERKAHTK
jgi:hypothetical protein